MKKQSQRLKMKKPRILVYDIETSPVRAWTFRVGYDIDIEYDQVVDGDRFNIICIGWKWLDDKKVHCLDWGCRKQDSEQMISKFTKIIEKADLAIAHNGDKFDLRQINTQRLIAKKPPISWPTTEDTLKQFKKHFYFPSYKLDYIAKLLLGEGKGKMVFKDWKDIVQYKDPDALEKMIKYCKRDVSITARCFKRAMAFFKPKIHAGIVKDNDKETCPRCGGKGSRSKGHMFTLAAKYRKRQCKSCFHIFRGARLKLNPSK